MSTYRERVDAGLCGKCGAKPEEGKLCNSCRDANRQVAADKRSRYAETGCISCGKPTDGKSKCEACRERDKLGRQARVRRRKAAGLCQVCGEPAKPGCTLCQAHIDKLTVVSSARYHKNKAAGVCRFCGEKTDGGAFCAEHREKDRAYKRDLKLAALNAYGGPKCKTCPETDVEVLEIDHVDGGGCRHRREIKRGSGNSFYSWLKQQGYPPGFQVLCPTCNKRKHVESKSKT